MNDETIEAKQLFLTEEIIKKGYDAQEFSVYLTEQKGEEKIDLEFWTMEDLKNTVKSFKELKLKKEDEKPSSKRFIKRRQSSAGLSNNRKKIKNRDNNSLGKATTLDGVQKNNRKKLYYNYISLNNEDNLDNSKSDEDDKNNNKITCIKLNENEITNRNDLYIKILLPEKSKKKILSSKSEVEIETIPIGFKSIRKINDFEYIHNKISLINPEIFNPVLYIHKSENTDAISSDSIIYLQLYMNSLINSSYFRTLPIVYDFLTKNQNEWEKIKNENYNTIKETNKRNEIPNLQGYFNLEFEVGDDEKCLNINEELNLKKEAFSKLNKNIDELLKLYDRICITLKNISESFGGIKNKYINFPNNLNLFAHLEVISQVWSEGISSQKQYLKNKFKYFFRYLNKENTSFLKYYENFKTSYNEFKSKFDKMSKTLYPSKKDKKILKKLQRDFSFKLVNVSEEYKILNESQGKRIEAELMKVCNEKNIIFMHIDNIIGLLNFFNIHKKEKKEEEKEKNKKEQYNNIEENKK